MYYSYAQYINGSTDELVKVFINCSRDKSEAIEICDGYAKEKKGIVKTWMEKTGSKSIYCEKVYA